MAAKVRVRCRATGYTIRFLLDHLACLRERMHPSAGRYLDMLEDEPD